nr:hypothetical protein [Geobacillus thermoleovorans]
MGLKSDYVREVKAFQPSPPYAANAVKAFLVGGALCALAQWLVIGMAARLPLRRSRLICGRLW